MHWQGSGQARELARGGAIVARLAWTGGRRLRFAAPGIYEIRETDTPWRVALNTDFAGIEWQAGDWVIFSEPEAATDPIAWPVRVFQTGGLGRTLAWNYCGVHYERGPLAVFRSRLDPPAILTSDGVRDSNPHASIEAIAYDSLGRKVWSGVTTNSTVYPGSLPAAPYTGLPPQLVVDPARFTLAPLCAAAPSPPWCGCDFPLDLDRVVDPV